MLYRAIVRPLLYLLPAETAHGLVFGALQLVTRIPGMRRLLAYCFVPRDASLAVRALGVTFPSPVGLAAGFDKDAHGIDALGACGFGFVEVGTITAQPQTGNARPRLFRLPHDRALLNRMGFNNHGATEAARRLALPRERIIVGANIGKTRVVDEEHAHLDYARSAAEVARYSDYVVVNVSSPNTPGLRDLQSVARLRPILTTVRETLDASEPSKRVPLLVKIAPDLADADIDEIAELALELRLDGIIATNTTTSRDALRTDADVVAKLGPGGLSGAPLKRRSLEVLQRLRAKVADRIVLVSVGGIENASDAWERIRAGATLVQVYTALIYEGPTLPRRIALGLARLAREAGYTSVQDAVGNDARKP